ncbi:MAG: homoserine kinase [Cenarchaeum symbiont of Oopsacas minuta]|nr:homoserine kinase [Cenarchaeum symbiont of Oopsacas minuta]
MVLAVTVKAPSSTANLGSGFDVFGLGLDAFYDNVTITKKGKGVRIVDSDGTPSNELQNTAGIVVGKMATEYGIKQGVEISIKKGVPAGFGLGSSAASAAAAAIAFDRLFKLNLEPDTLVRHAGQGERASAGTIHYDNVAASVLGGFVIIRDKPLRIMRIEAPKDLALCVAVPHIDVPKKKTKVSRSILSRNVSFEDCTKNISNAASMAAAFAVKDSEVIGGAVNDVIVEPIRKTKIPGFEKIRKGVMEAGAYGFTISGAGPSVIAFSTTRADLDGICNAMEKGFLSSKTKCTTIICRPSAGAIRKKGSRKH